MRLEQSLAARLTRPLSALEKLFWLVDQNRPMHFAMTAEIEGPSKVALWQEAIDHVCRQCPLIWSRIVRDDDAEPVLEVERPSSILLEVVSRAVDDWSEHVAAQLERRFDASRAPLLRAILLHEPDRAVLILCVHYSVADARGLSMLLRDVLRAYAGEPVMRSQEMRSTEEMIAGRYGRFSVLPAEAPATARGTLGYRPLEASPRIEALRLAADTTALLRERARQEETTMHGVLCAALSTAAAAMVPEWSQPPLRVLTPIDVRGRLLGGSEHCGLCVQGVVLQDRCDMVDMWERARWFSDQLEPAKDPAYLSGLFAVLEELVAPVSTADAAGELLAQGFSAELLLSNLGDMGLAETYGPLTLRALWGPAVHTGFAMGHTIGVATVAGRLHLLHTSFGPPAGLLTRAATLLIEAAAAQ